MRTLRKLTTNFLLVLFASILSACNRPPSPTVLITFGQRSALVTVGEKMDKIARDIPSAGINFGSEYRYPSAGMTIECDQFGIVKAAHVFDVSGNQASSAIEVLGEFGFRIGTSKNDLFQKYGEPLAGLLKTAPKKQVQKDLYTRFFGSTAHRLNHDVLGNKDFQIADYPSIGRSFYLHQDRVVAFRIYSPTLQ